METPAAGSKPKWRTPTVLAGGCLVVLYLAFFAGTAFAIQQRGVIRIGPIPTATAVSTPHILVHQPPDDVPVRHEDFSSNGRDWGLYYHRGKLEVIDGKLVLQSNAPGGLVIGTSRAFAPATGAYYVQADFSTDRVATAAYGLIFGLSRSLGTYYAFELWPAQSRVVLFKYNTGKWDMLAPPAPCELNRYPAANTLGVYFNRGDIELYVNGVLASTLSDDEYFQSSGLGFFVGGQGPRLFVDDVFAYDAK